MGNCGGSAYYNDYVFRYTDFKYISKIGNLCDLQNEIINLGLSSATIQHVTSYEHEYSFELHVIFENKLSRSDYGRLIDFIGKYGNSIAGSVC